MTFTGAIIGPFFKHSRPCMIMYLINLVFLIIYCKFNNDVSKSNAICFILEEKTNVIKHIVQQDIATHHSSTPLLLNIAAPTPLM